MRLIDADNLKIPNDAPYKASVKRVVAQQQTVEAVPVVHGEWINTDGYDEWTCSECGQEENCDDYPTEYGINFCSRCGADMRKKV